MIAGTTGVPIAAGAIGVFIGGLLAFALWLVAAPQRRRSAAALVAAEQGRQEALLQLAVAQERLAAAQHTAVQLQQLEQVRAALAEQLREQSMRLAAAETRLTEERRAFAEKQAVWQEAEREMTERFENLANRILEDKAQRFTEQNRTNLEALMQPFKEQLGEFRKKIDEVHVTDSQDRASLREVLRQLQAQTQQINQDAVNLTRALKGDKRAQGAWGELVLEKVLEQSGLRRGVEYEPQGSFRSDDGARLRPDVIIHLPDGKDVVIDSKVSLVAYERHVGTSDEMEQASALREHIAAVRRHIEQLSAKDYAGLPGLRSLDFVLMFMPIEAAFVAAFQADEQLFAAAFEKHIVVVTPTTLLATLRTIDNIWRYERQNENARAIGENAAKLYDKFCGFVDDLEKIGTGIASLQKNYDEAMNKLTRGRGNLVRQVEGFRDLGVRPKKALPKGLLEDLGVD